MTVSTLIEMIVEIREIALFTRATPGSSLVVHIFNSCSQNKTIQLLKPSLLGVIFLEPEDTIFVHPPCLSKEKKIGGVKWLSLQIIEILCSYCSGCAFFWQNATHHRGI